jgi:hypothetical protein
MSGIFSEHCFQEMWNLYNTPGDEVGSDFTGEKRGRTITNCIIYVSNVLIYAHDKIRRSDISERVKQLGKIQQDGSKLANYLVRELGWSAHYWNPDVRNPRDSQSEHPASYKQVLETKTYLPRSSNLPISGLVVDYNKQNKKPERVWVPVQTPPFPIPIPIPISVPADNTKILEKLEKVKFAFGISRGGTHTFLLSYGYVFEVHWDQEGPRLYGRRVFKDYNWNSGALITPLDSTFTSDEIKAR